MSTAICGTNMGVVLGAVFACRLRPMSEFSRTLLEQRNSTLNACLVALPPRFWRHQAIRAIVDNKLAVVLAAVLNGECPDGGVVGQPVPEKLRCFVQSHVALLLNHFRSVCHGLLHELHHVDLGPKNVTRRIVALAEVGPEV